MRKFLRIAALLVVTFVVYIVLNIEDYGEKLEFNDTDVYFTQDVTEAEAQKLGEYLVEAEFTDGGSESVQLSERDSIYLFRMVVKDGIVEDSANDVTLLAMTYALSLAVFDGAPVELEACDEVFETLRVYGAK